MSDLIEFLPKKVRLQKTPEGIWTDESKRKFLDVLVSCGNLRQACELTRLPYGTALVWRKQEWWPNLLEEVKQEKRAILAAKLEGIVDRAIVEVQDRLENGDHVLVNKTGEIVRKPLNSRDAVKIVNDLTNTKIKLEQQQQQSTQQQQTVQEVLKTLASEFAKMNKKQTTDVIDVSFKEIPDAIHDQRTPGLQEGSSEVYQSP